MVFAAQKLRLHPALSNPTVLIVVDRIDLDTQITGTFNAADVPNLVTADSREELQTLLAQDARKIIITTIHKFGEAGGVLNDRDNIIVMVDEAHRTQEGDLGRQDARGAAERVPVRPDRHADQQARPQHLLRLRRRRRTPGGYLSRYSLRGVDPRRGHAAAALRAAAGRAPHRPGGASTQAFAELTGDLTEEDQADLLARRPPRLARAGQGARARRARSCADIVEHFQEKVAPNGFKAQVVTFDREACVALQARRSTSILPPEASDDRDDGRRRRAAGRGRDATSRDKDEEEKLLDRFRDPADPLKILIVTAKLLTGFDAPILQAHVPRQADAGPHPAAGDLPHEPAVPPDKTHGLIVDYLGIFDDVAQALAFDDEPMRQVITNIDELKDAAAGRDARRAWRSSPASTARSAATRG